MLCEKLFAKALLGINGNLHFTNNGQVCINLDKGILLDDIIRRLAFNK
jgi:hypothetical protein